MAKNPNIDLLGANQIAKRIYDPLNDANRVVIVGANEFSISLDRTDQIETYSGQSVMSGTINVGVAANTELAITDSNGFRTIQLYSQTNGALTGASTVRVQVSPSASGTDFIDLGLSLVSGTANGAMSISAITNICARRVRLVSTTAPVGNSVTYRLVLNG